MNWLISIVASFLGILGALTLLSQLVKELGKPNIWKSIDESKRSFILLCTAIVVGGFSGTWLNYKSNKKKIFISILYDLEVKLVQMEGLIFSALADTTPFKSMKLLDKFLGYLDKYQGQIEAILKDISNVNDKINKELKKHLDSMIIERKKIDLNNLDERYIDSLQSMLENVGKMRSIVKREIYGLEQKK